MFSMTRILWSGDAAPVAAAAYIAIRAPRSFHCHWFCSISFMILQKEALIMLERVELANLFLFILCKDERATVMLSTFGILNGTPFHHSFIRAHTHTSIWKMFTHRTHIDPFKVTLSPLGSISEGGGLMHKLVNLGENSHQTFSVYTTYPFQP